MSAAWTPAYVGIGSNLDDPQRQVTLALDELARLRNTKLIARSGLYRSTPLGPQDQPDFVNAAAGLLTQCTALELLHELKRLEAQLGRETPVLRWGPRRIDFDLLVYGAERIDTEQLHVPHLGLPTRHFVLYPLLDFAPDLLVPGHGSVRQLAARVPSEGLISIAAAV